MTQDSKFAQAIEKGTFIFTAELLPCAYCGSPGGN